MRKFYLILVLFILVIGALNAAPIKDSLSSSKKGLAMGGCDPPIINADSLLLQYFTNQPLSATGGVPPYTYSFSPAIPSSELINPPDSSIIYTITVTGANGCDSSYHAHYVPLPPGTTSACDAIFISQYIQDTVNHDIALELYNPTSSSISLSDYCLLGTTNGSLLSTPSYIALHGTIDAYQTFLIVNRLADTSLTHKAKMLSDSLNFGGKDIVTLAKMVISPPNLSVAFLDEVGTVYPLPTDSGWAVASGCTKNHTLVRKVSVTQGDLNWSTCQNEWNVYARGTFSYIGHYTNTCHIDPVLGLYIANGADSCGDPSYYEFSVMAYSVPKPSIFNSCTFEIKYTGKEFAGDEFPHYTILISPGTNFGDYNDIGINQASDTTLGVLFGDPSDSLVDGTVLDSIPQELLRIKLEVQNSCAPGKVMLVDTLLKSDDIYAEIDSSGHPDSMKIALDTVCHKTGDTLGPPYVISNCCQWDIYGNCDSICYDTIDTYPVYQCDTVWGWKPDTTYTFTSYSNLYYTNVVFSPYDSLLSSGSGCPPVIEPLDPVNAGTNGESVPANSSILTIKGANFGSEEGTIDVPNANQGGIGLIQLDSMDILSWTNSKIVVRMPSVINSNANATPGTGVMTVNTSCGQFDQEYLTINYSITGGVYSGEKLRWNMAMSDDTNSIVFRCDTSISNHSRIYADVLQAISEWNCYTGINWKMGSDIISDSSAQDGVSVIYFTNSLPPGTIMLTSVYLDDGCNDMGDSMAYVHEADIAISQIPQAGYTWNYDVSDTVIPGNYYYFYDALLHELGHAHLLNHVDDINSLMYYQANTHLRKNLLSGDYPGPQTLYGGFDVVNTSAVNTPSCSYGILIPSSRVCVDSTLNINSVLKNQYQLNLYPNPVSTQNLTISYDLTQDSYIQFEIIDYTGREVMILGNEHKPPGSYKEQINTDAFANGIYLLVANINGTIQTIKFIKL